MDHLHRLGVVVWALRTFWVLDSLMVVLLPPMTRTGLENVR
jgi:hypothetical protein